MKKPDDKTLSAADQRLWQHVLKTVKPIKSAKTAVKSDVRKVASAKSPSTKSTGKKVEHISENSELTAKPLRGAVTKTLSVQPLDRNTRKKISKNDLPIAATVDLHGMTEAEAYKAIRRFIARAFDSEKRIVLVITGKGKVGGGVLRRALPLWLEGEVLRSMVSGYSQAADKDGGAGAFYVRLRKRK